jgi:hypothetical protein
MGLLSQVQVMIRGVQKYYANALDDEMHEDLVVIFNDLLAHAKEKYPDDIFIKNISPVGPGTKIKNYIIKLDLFEDTMKTYEEKKV